MTAPLQPIPWLALGAVISMISIVGLTLGYTYPALSLLLEARGFSAVEIGLQTAMAGLGTIAGSLLSPWLTSRFGPWNVAIASVFGTALTVLAFAFVPPIAAWYPLRIVLGMTTGLLFIISETWVNELAPDHARGRIVAIYTSTVAGLFALGPLSVTVLGFDGIAPYAAVATILLLMGAPLLFMRAMVPPPHPAPTGSVWEPLRLVPVLLFAVFAFGFLDAAMLGLWAVFALERGVEVGRAAVLLTVFIAGNVFLQVPLGWVADRTDKRAMFVLCALAGAVGAAILPAMDLLHWTVMPYLVVYGALAFGVYTLAMTIIGETFRGSALVAINAGFAIMWGLGNLVGGAATGLAMQELGSVGFCVAMGAPFAVLTVFSLLHRLSPPPVPRPVGQTA